MIVFDIYIQSDKMYQPIEEYNWGIKCFNKFHKREAIIRIETDIEKISGLLDRGWSLIPGIKKWLLRSPEVMIYDLSDIWNNPTQDPLEVYVYCKLLKKYGIENVILKTIQKIKDYDLKFIILKGESLESCIRISGSDERIKDLPFYILKRLQEEKDWRKEMKKAKSVLKPRRLRTKLFLFKKCSQNTKLFFNKISEKYVKMERKIKVDFIYRGCWKKFPHYDTYLFIPTSGFQFMLGFIEDTKKHDRIAFWEWHETNNGSKEVYWTEGNSFGQKIAIVDLAYTGRSIEHISERLKNKEKRRKIDNIGLFPKSRMCFSKLNYALILDKFLEVSKLNYRDKDFFDKIFIEIVNEEKNR